MYNKFPTPKNKLFLTRYIKLIEYYKVQQLNVYCEKHHILPKSMFPEYAKESWNIVTVPARVHFLLHYCLWKAYRNRKTWNAFKFMNSSNSNQSRYLNSKLYNSLKTEQFQMAQSQKDKISASLKGRVFSTATKQKMSAWQKGTPKKSWLPKNHSDETKLKISLSQKGKPRPETTGSKNGMSKPVYIGSYYFESVKECSLQTTISPHNIRNYVRYNRLPAKGNDIEKFEKYLKGLRN